MGSGFDSRGLCGGFARRRRLGRGRARSRYFGGRRRFGAGLDRDGCAALQRGELRVADLEQSSRFGEFGFELLHAGFEIACRSSCGRAGRGGRRRRRRGRRGRALVGCHEAEPTCIGRGARPCGGRRAGTGAPGAPVVVLACHLGRSGRGRDARHFRGLWNSQRAARVQHVDVARERGGVLLVDGHHRAIDVGARARVGRARDAIQGVVRADLIRRARFDAGHGGRGGDRRRAVGLHGRRRFGGRRLGCHRLGHTHARRTAGTHARRGDGWCSRLRRARCVDRGVEQDGVLAQQAAARPAGLDEQRDEGLGDGSRRSDPEHVAAIRGLADAEAEVGQVARTVEPVAGERLAGSERGAERAQVVLRGRHELDLGVEGLVQGRIQANIAQPERVQHARGHQRAQKQDAAYGSSHRVSHQSRIRGMAPVRATGSGSSRDFCKLDITIAHG